jgi:hypothetical protein
MRLLFWLGCVGITILIKRCESLCLNPIDCTSTAMTAQQLILTVDCTVNGFVGGTDVSAVEATLFARGQRSMALSVATELWT